MPIDLFDGVRLTIEAALTTTQGGFGVWSTGTGPNQSLWDSALWGPDEVWTDISRWMRTTTVDGGFSDETRVWETGTGELVLTNDGRFSSTNLSGPYVAAGVSAIKSGVPIQIRATYAGSPGTTYPIGRRYARRWIRGYDDANADAWVSVPLVDEWDRFKRAGGVAVTPVGADESFGARVSRLLNAAGYTGERRIAVGTNTMQATDLNRKIADELTITADSEGGTVYVAADGAVVAEQQAALIEQTRSITVQGVFGDNPTVGEVPYASVAPDDSLDQVRNIVAYTRVGGTQQLCTDSTSREIYGDASDPRADLICSDDAQVAQLAAWKLARSKDAEERFSQLVLRPRHGRWGPRIWPQVLGRQVRDLIQVWRRMPGEDPQMRYCHIAAIRHDITLDDWVTTWKLTSATPYVRFVGSKWDAGLWGSSDVDPAAALWFF